MVAGAVAISSVAGQLFADPPVLARMDADPEYEAARALWDPPKDETYVVYQGKFYPGTTVDRTLERMPFMDIVQNLAPDLKKQHYVPAQDFATADLILVVHWGVTVGADRVAALFMYSTNAQTESRDMTNEFGAAWQAHLDATGGGSIETEGMSSIEYNPELMGMRAQMNDAQGVLQTDYSSLRNDSWGSTNLGLLGLADIRYEENKKVYLTATMNTVNDMLDEDRYFVIVMAYDRKSIEGGGRPKRLWSARLSMRSPGVNFRGAMDYLSEVGGRLFGTTTVGLTIKRAKKNEGQVKLGEMKIIEYKTPAAKK